MLNTKEVVFVGAMEESNPCEKDLINLAVTISDMSNNFGFRRDEVAEAIKEEPTKSKNATILAAAWISFWAKQPSYMFDGRNEISGEYCLKIVATEPFQTYLKETEGTELYRSYTKMFGMPYSKYGSTLHSLHRTLMQTVSGLMFKLAENGIDGLHEEMSDQSGNGWYKMPLI